MHRFRKRSDAKRTLEHEQLHDSESHEYQSLPELPPVSNFRTSLILPGLSRRFTLLRTSSGDPVSLEDLRTRFAEQRARGAENQISEEEEDMLLETLSRLRANTSTGIGKAEEGEGSTFKAEEVNLNYQPSFDRQSMQSTSTAASSISPGSLMSSPSGRSTKRYSNNLFGSGRFRDYTYIRNVSSQRARSAISSAPSDSSLSLRGNGSIYSDSLRPVTPDSAPSSSVQSSPEKAPLVRSAPLMAPVPYTDFSGSVAEYRLSKTLTPSNLKRASLALEEAIKEIEEEAEDEIVMPRSTPVSRAVVNEQNRSSVESNDSSELRRTSSIFEAGTAISSDKQVLVEPDVHRTSPIPLGRPGTASPTPRLPGYIPGMPRPMTPRDISLDSDDQSRSHSTTPRATSPLLPTLTDQPTSIHSSSLASGLPRRGSNASTSRGSPLPHSPSAASPHFSSSSQNGPLIPEDHQRNGENFSVDFENAVNSTVFGRRRAASPLAGPAYQPMAVSSRPGTPSNVIWNPTNTPKSYSTNDSVHGHNRNGSWISDVVSSDLQDAAALGRKSTSRSLRSPALPDSPLIDHGYVSNGPFGWKTSGDPPVSENRPESISGIDLNSPVSASNLVLRSLTPTQTAPRSPTSPTFSNYETSPNVSPRSSKPNASTSPFNFGPFHPLVFSPLPLSSRSSLESAGSSYHSLEGERHKDRGLNIFSGIDPPQAVWHDISPTDKSSSVTPGGSQDDEFDTEDIIARYAGLTKSDFVAIQEKLVGAAMAKTSTPDTRDRAPSLRRRRPSTSQSNYSLNGRDTRVASPAPQAQSPASLTASSHNPDKSLKASALLDSVVDSIQSPRNQIITVPNEERIGPTPQPKGEISPTSRKNRDLAQALFGLQGRDRKAPPPPEPTGNPTTTSASNQPAINVSSFPDPRASPTPKESNPVTPVVSSYQLSRRPPTPQVLEEQGALEKEVQQKVEAATLALRSGPSPKSPEGTSTLSRRKISPHQISTPRLVSASTSVDTIPLPSPSVVPTHGSKIGQRIRRLRGTLRAKASVPAAEVTPYPLNIQSTQASPDYQTVRYDPATINVPGGIGATSATELGRSKVPFHSPPASAGPGLRGFMARFRKQRPADIPLEPDRRGPPPLTANASSKPTSPQHEPSSHHTEVISRIDTPVSAPSALARLPPFASSKSPGIQQDTHEPQVPQHTPEEPNDADDDLARRQIFDAASNLGLDQAALQDLNDLLSRSKSTASSRSAALTVLSRNNSTSASFRTEIPDDDVPRSLPISGRPSVEDASRRADDTIIRKLSIRKPADHTRKPRDTNGDSAINAIVRRTIIYPSESRSSTIDLNVLLRKNSQSTRRRRSASATSISSRSVQDRAPTPPPPRSPTARRFSTDTTPPLPQLPPSFSSQAENLHALQSTAAAGPIEKSSSTYDSLYEMYAGESKGTNTAANEGPDIGALPNSESGPALEVVELANGETIWSIVNGLRDDDDESVYGNRASFASEHSTRETSSEGVQVFFKEHGRTGSKGSNASFLSRKKSPGKPRPETKVFYSSSAQIGKLIENLSQGMESGSFNFQLPQANTYPPGRSNPSSFHSEGTDMHWTVEERLEHMLGSIGAG